MHLTEKHCVPCEGGTDPLSNSAEDELLKEVKDWEIDRTFVHKIRRTFALKDFLEAMEFVKAIAEFAEEEGHHPDIHISYRKVTIEFYTHAILGLSVNDFIMAAKIDSLAD